MSTTLKLVLKTMADFHRKSGIPILKNTPVSSPLYPGQFCYCLDEMHWFEKYGNFTDLPVGEDFQKIQPCIRMCDFENFYCVPDKQSVQHLGLFTMATIAGGRVVSIQEARKAYQESVASLLRLFDTIGLELSRLKVTCFSGNSASNIEMSRKKAHQERKILVDKYIPEDGFKNILLECDLQPHQIEGNDTRDNYLTSNWYNIVVPWGYRNEFLYQMPDGSLLDIATIERLDLKPIIEKRNGEGFVVDLEPWDRAIVLNVVGIERLLMAVEDASSIHETSLFRPFGRAAKNVRESVRILHRIFSDLEWKDMNKHRKKRIRFLMRVLERLPAGFLHELLTIHSQQYHSLFPELSDGIEKTIREIKDYRRRIEK